MSEPAGDQVRLTTEQRRPLVTRAVSVALAAGAGCGKTTVLTERFLGEIDGDAGRPLRALAAMTFTDKAARELRQRIRARCRSKLAAGANPSWWTSVLRALEAAPIGTFHEFCGRLLRGYARGLAVDPEFAILDATIAGSLREQAVGTSIRRLLSRRDPDLLALGVVHGLKPIREMLESALANRTPDEIDPLCSLAPEELVERWRAAWASRGRPAVLSKLGPAARRCRSVLENLEETTPKLLALRQEVLDALSALDGPGCTDDDVTRLRESARIAGLRGKDWPNDAIKEDLKKVFTDLRDGIGKVLEKSIWDEGVTRESAEEVIQFARLVREVRTDYDELKVRHRGLDFSDLIVRTRDVLRDLRGTVDTAATDLDPTALEFVLIDEFQDTDQVQSDILRLLGGEAFLDGRMFVVGDAKQSIYRFRGAEPAIFGRWRDEFLEAGRLRLSENFRTVPRVLHFVNALFADLFGEESRLGPVRPDHGPGPNVHFFWVPPPATDDDEQPAKPSVLDGRIREAEALARWLRLRIDAGWTVVDRKTREIRPAHPGDVALLLRAMTDVWPYETALADQGFEYHTIGGSAFYSQQEILDVVNLLSVVEDPLDEVALAGCLRSPFFAMTDEGLYWLSKAVPGAGLSLGLDAASEAPGLSPHDRKQAERARGFLARWRGLKDHVPMADLLSRILDESGFEAALVCEFLGSRKLANVRKLVRTARDFDRRGGFGLADFVGRLRAFADDPPREEQATTTEEDSPSVRIMTVHQAKGLEFPIVILPDLNKNVGARTASLGFDRELGLVLKPRPEAGVKEASESGSDESLGWRTFRAIEDHEEREEALRLFYVAATRARDHLVLSAGFGTPLEAVSVAKLSPALNLVWERFDGSSGRCLASLPDGWPTPEIEVIDVASLEPTETRASRRPRVDLLEIVDAVVGTPCDRDGSSPSRGALPRFIDLDGPRIDGSRASRIGGLIREAAIDPDLLAGESPGEVAARVGGRMTPSAGGGRIAEAERWLGAWVESPFFGRLKTAPADRLRRARGWTLQGTSRVVRGSCDAIVQGEDGGWRPLVFLARGESESWGRLRASLSIPALARSGFQTVGPAWLLRVGTDGSLRVERRAALVGADFDSLLRLWLDADALEPD
ncbi:MAG: UvrD-helicase domain-containing protein [Paludisphaera borealis]|uniref:UvrD-helicase domain-containing protein n=1 Tax=Paludisphaera borealis TaxID=1387353 RepID=UPI002844556B|nr:UvrD-helicase domain-containing protein [Paludisphaera borealis]MDR3621873.1 UvrD-helicase domain-containing protein [Paludisphaera borealis]